MKSITVAFHPDLLDPRRLDGAVAVVIDQLRATTTIVHALAAKARNVVVCGEVDEARQVASAWWENGTVLGGEREGVKIDGFALGNSPEEYTPAAVAGRTVVFTTTNGTRALLKARTARRVVTAALANLNAVLQAIAAEPQLVIVCAGTRGQVTLEDVYVAGAIVEELTIAQPEKYELDDSASIARSVWRPVAQSLANVDPTEQQRLLLAALRQTQGGRNLIALGLEHDVSVAARRDTHALLPELAPGTMTLHVV